MSDGKMSNDEIEDFYSSTKESYIDCLDIDNSYFDKHYVTNRYNNSNYIIAPLNNSFETLGTYLNYDYKLNKKVKKDLDDLFVFEKDYFKNYVYKSNGHRLAYTVPYSPTMHIGV